MAYQNKAPIIRRYGPMLAAVLLGLALTGLATHWVQEIDLAEARGQFHTAAAEKLDRIESSVHGHIDGLEAIGSLFENVGVVEFEVFKNFVQPLMQRHAGAQAFEWVPYVTHAERAKAEAKMHNLGYSDFSFRERDMTGKMIRAAERSEYFPVYYVEPMGTNYAAFGFDMRSNPAHRFMMEKSRASGEMIATAPKPLVQESGTQAGFLVFIPVYKKGTDKNNEFSRRIGIMGFGLAVFRIGDLVNSALLVPDALGLVDINIFDVAKGSSVKEIYGRASAGETAAQRLELLKTGEYYMRTFELFGREWQMFVVPSVPLADTVGLSWSLFLIGLIATAASAAYMYGLSTRSAMVERAVQDQTKELRDARDDAEKAQHTAEQADKAKSSFLATMSHELRTPLTGVLGYIDLLASKVTDPEHQQILGKLKQAADAQRSIVNDVLDYSKISAGALELEAVPFNLQELVEAVANTYSAVTAEGVVLGYSIESSVPKNFIGDPARLQQVISNLVSNSVKFTAKGSITIHVDGALDMTSAACVQYGLMLSVQDTGCGILEEKQENLFNPFIQADSSIARVFGGTGLGLAIVHEIVGAMGGTVALESKPGLGTKFTVTLKLPVTSIMATQILKAPRTKDTPSKSKLRPLRILIADDYRLIREMLSATLVEAGHSVVAVENGSEAVETMICGSSVPIDLILMDMHMPIMTGLEAVTLIRALPAPICDIPIIGLSADAVKDHVENYIEAGLDAYVTKPIDWGRLRQTITDVVNRKSPTRNLANETNSLVADFSGELIVGQVFAEFAEHLDEARYRHILKTTIEFFAECCVELDGLAVKPDFVKLKRIAHSIAGAASTVGAMKAASMAREIADMTAAPEDMAGRASSLGSLMRRSHMEFESQFSGPPH